LGFLAQRAAARGVTATSGVAATGFSLQAMLYRGPARLFTYDDVQYTIKLEIRHQAGASVPGLAHWVWHVVLDWAAYAAAVLGYPASGESNGTPAPAQAAEPAGATRQDTLTGSGQFISHEELARHHPADPEPLIDAGKTEVR